MPIYEYQCESCGHRLEALQKISDPPLTDCPACAQATLRKRISAVGFRLKGGGWYETDFKRSERRRNIAGDAAQGEAGGKARGGDSAPAGTAGATGSTASSGSDSAPAKSAGGDA